MQSPAGLRRLSVRADDVCVDVTLPAAVPLEALLPSITHTLAKTGNVTVDPVLYGLSDAGGVVLDGSKTLSENGIRDGTALTLIHLHAGAPTARFDDAAEAVSAAVATVEQRWHPRASHFAGTLVASGLAGVSVGVLWINAFGAGGEHRADCVGVAATIGLLSLLAAAIAYRIGEDGAGLTLGMLATAFSALAGCVAVPGGPGAANALLGTAAATTAAALVRVISCHAAVFTALMCCAATCCTAAAVCVMCAAPLPAVGAGMAALSLALIEASPSASITLARLSPGSVDDQLQARAIRAHSWLTSLIAAFSAATALGAIGVLTEPSLPHIVFAIVTGSILILRARTRHDIRHSASSIVCGAITLGAALVASAMASPHLALHIAALSMMLSVVALYAGFMTSATTVPSTARRSIELLQYFALAAVTPLALWLCGIYGAVRGLNLP
jgi:type VII secretion integral membrane protein EccD